MAVPGAIFGSKIGPERTVSLMAQVGVTGYAMAAVNTGYCARFVALSTKDVASVRLRWATVTAGGTVELRIETIDATTGRPTGTLYDANATISFTPVSGIQTYTFVSVPTTGLVEGTQYGIVLLTTTGGTTHTLAAYRAGNVPSYYPTATLTAADGTTRSNFAEVSQAIPCLSLVMDDATEEDGGMLPYTNSSGFTVYGTRAAALKFVLTRSETIAGVCVAAVTRTGTPAGDVRIRILNSSDSAVSGTTVTADKDSLTNITNNGMMRRLPVPVTLTAGTYRVVIDSASSVDASNCWTINAATFLSSGAVPSSFRLSTTTDVTAGPPITWTDSTTDIAGIELLIDDEASVPSAGMLVHPGMSGGFRG